MQSLDSKYFESGLPCSLDLHVEGQSTLKFFLSSKYNKGEEQECHTYVIDYKLVEWAWGLTGLAYWISALTA